LLSAISSDSTATSSAGCTQSLRPEQELTHPPIRKCHEPRLALRAVLCNLADDADLASVQINVPKLKILISPPRHPVPATTAAQYTASCQYSLAMASVIIVTS